MTARRITLQIVCYSFSFRGSGDITDVMDDVVRIIAFFSENIAN